MAINRTLFLSGALGAVLAMTSAASAESLIDAMSAAYSNNPTLNAARAGTRATDEKVPQALAGYRPSINAYVQGEASWSDGQKNYRGNILPNETDLNNYPISVGVTLNQTIYNGGKTGSAVKAAEASVMASRESLRNTEQTTLQNSVIAYMNVIEANQILALRQSNVEFLQEQVRASRDRFQVGEGTRTDVSQAEAALAAATSAVSAAKADTLSASATYLEVVGHKPGSLKAPGTVAALLPKQVETAVDVSRREHPAILAALHNVDASAANVAFEEGALLPTFTLSATVDKTVSQMSGVGASGVDNSESLSGSVIGKLSIPIYQGGSEYASIRQAKEELGQAKIQVDAVRDQVNTALVSAWGNMQSSSAQIDAAKAQVDASQLALEGVIEEQKVGQRTTLDVLNSQSDLITAKIQLVSAQRNVVVASYAVLSAMGRLDHDHLGLQVAAYKPEQHYTQVRDKWFGLRTPDGR